jgi:hypothetical protein
MVFLLYFLVLLVGCNAGQIRGKNPSPGRHLVSHSEECKITFVKYTSSKMEQKWVENVESWQNNVCSHITDAEMMEWIHGVEFVMNDTFRTTMRSPNETPDRLDFPEVLSYFTYQHKCASDSHAQYTHVPIEPTVALARDPRKCWKPMSENFVQSKEYLLPLSKIAAHQSGRLTKIHHANQTNSAGRFFLFDAGASVATTKPNSFHWSGTDWIVKWYQTSGVVFDEIHAWEPRKRTEPTPDAIFANKLHFYPFGVVDKVGDEKNPLTLIKKICRPEDYVVFKLDIDNVAEEGIVKQILASPELMGLIDEFYYEMHVLNDVMAYHGLGIPKHEYDHNRLLAGWYKMAIPARHKGFRMHFWP